MFRAEDPSRSVVRDLIFEVSPYDNRESADRAWMLDWVDSGIHLFRLAKPATPPQHLAVYAALLDEESHSILLVDHVKAKAWLMPCGHVDQGEDPRGSLIQEWRDLSPSSPTHWIASRQARNLALRADGSAVAVITRWTVPREAAADGLAEVE